MSKLRECPFCGGEAEESFQEKDLSLCIRCKECGAKGPTYVGHGYDIGKYIDDMRKDVIDAWNRRTK